MPRLNLLAMAAALLGSLAPGGTYPVPYLPRDRSGDTPGVPRNGRPKRYDQGQALRGGRDNQARKAAAEAKRQRRRERNLKRRSDR